MKNLCKCDICSEQAQMPTVNRLPDNWEKIDGNDLCSECRKEYKKKYKKMWIEFVKDKIKPSQ